MSAQTRVLVIDDSALTRRLLSDIVNQHADMTCVGTAADALLARDMTRQLDPDVLTLDVEMLRMDGLEFLRRLMHLRPTPVVMVSSLTQRGAEATLRAPELGAVDLVAKPQGDLAGGLKRLGEDIAEKIRAAARAQVRRTAAASGTTSIPPPEVAALGPAGDRKVIFVGASTGGTEATRELLSRLPADAPPIMVAQHMPPGYTRALAAHLDALCRIRVREATNGERLQPGHAYLAPGGLHLRIVRSGAHYVACVRDGDPALRHKPSVEVLFDSAARVAGANALGVMLTGMGNDGAPAMRAMREAGAYNVAQDEASCVVFGMPREAIAAGAIHRVLPLPEIAGHLTSYLRRGAPITHEKE